MPDQELIPFRLGIKSTDHTFHHVYEPTQILQSQSVKYGLTVAAEALNSVLLENARIKKHRADKPYPVIGTRDHLALLSPYRPEVDHVEGWMGTDALLREAAARNHNRNWIFRDRDLEIEGVYIDPVVPALSGLPTRLFSIHRITIL